MRIGSYNHLRLIRSTTEGLMLSDGVDEALLPQGQVPLHLNLEEELLVFVYHHKDGRMVATTKQPYACVGDFAFLKVIDKTDTGVYLDLGIDKDLFVPPKEGLHLEQGRSYVVFIYLDEVTGRITGTTRLEDYTEADFTDLEEGDEVSLLIYAISDLGYSAVIDNRYMGLLYRDEVYEKLDIGDTRIGYTKKIRNDIEKIDLSLRQIGFDFILNSKDALLNVLKENGGVLHLGDKSTPDAIRDELKMSKKAFKQVIGGLYKQKLITISDYEIRLVRPNKETDYNERPAF